MTLDARLQAIADCLPPDTAAVADIGTDHGKLPLWLLTHGRAAAAIATDKHPEPLETARRTLAGANAQLRLGDGLAPLLPNEADVIVIAGMGGELISAILADDANGVLPTARRLVLQPQSDAETLRRWLYAHGWHIAAERLALVHERLYVVLAAEHGWHPMPTPLELLLGVGLSGDPLYPRHVAEVADRHRRILAGLRKSRGADPSRVAGLENLLRLLDGELR